MPHRTYDGATDTMYWFCSDTCHQGWAGDAYGGWNGGWVNEDTYYCAMCGRVLVGANDTSACQCQRDAYGQCWTRTTEGTMCDHERWIQLPRFRCDGYRRMVERGVAPSDEVEIEEALAACGCSQCSGHNRTCHCATCRAHRSEVIRQHAVAAYEERMESEHAASVTHFDSIDQALGVIAQWMEDEHDPIPRPMLANAIAYVRSW